MSTRFYVETKKCGCCGRSDEWLMASSLCVFRTYPNDASGHNFGPTTEPIDGWEDWEALLMSGEYDVHDEYGDAHHPWDIVRIVELQGGSDALRFSDRLC